MSDPDLEAEGLSRPAVIVGIDPGLDGAIAVLEAVEGDILALIDMPTQGDPDRWVAPWLARGLILDPAIQVAAIAMEKVRSRRGNAAQTVFKLGDCRGAMLGAWSMREDFSGIEEVPPARWRKAHGIEGHGRAELKTEARRAARMIWPDDAWRFRRVGDDGRAEAALIAEARRITWIEDTGLGMARLNENPALLGLTRAWSVSDPQD